MSGKRYALISVTNKDGVIDFANHLQSLGFSILSTGGTSKLLKSEKIDVIDVATFTGLEECLDGRVKTLHPMVHGGLLADRTNPSHVSDMKKFGYEAIDVVAVNLYDFANQASGKNLDLTDAIQHIDIGGPAMLRAAAKNYKNVYVVVDPKDYPMVIESIKNNDAKIRSHLAQKVFAATASYDKMIADEFQNALTKEISSSEAKSLPSKMSLQLEQLAPLRYGENSHQAAGIYTINGSKAGLTSAKILQGKELSYNNYVDLEAASGIVSDLSPLPACTIIKHTNPCGTAVLPKSDFTAKHLFLKALASDPKCAFGGIVAFNIPVDEDAATAMSEIFLECVIAPSFTAGSLKIFGGKKNLRIVESNCTLRSGRQDPWQARSIVGGMLIQTLDDREIDHSAWRCVSNLDPTSDQLKELAFAMAICRNVKSNAIVLTRNLQSIGIGAGQMSRIDSAKIAVEKSIELGHGTTNSVAASDAFFPFRDTVDLLAKAGVKAIVHPGGSLKDQESIDAANEHAIVMMITGVRHFKH
jgi:phosphoribosylaminoimidazolecarboxamide formyltransferase / IMP cyclohydrolase